MNPIFETYKLRRFIQTNGTTYTFKGKGLNEFGEPSGDEVLVEVPGVYHETQGYVEGSGDDGGNSKTKPNSLILCLKSEAGAVKPGMSVDINESTYKVTDLRDVEQFALAYDISLELVLK